MKKIFLLSMLTSIAMICACQKKDSAAQQQLAQRNAELDRRETALDERVNALNERVNSLDGRVKALAEKERATAAETIATGPETQVPDPAQVQAERHRAIQQLSAMIPSRSQIEEAEKEREILRAQKVPGLGTLQSQQQLGADELERIRQRKLEAAGISPAPQ
jgi:hypothetical protein